MKIQKCLRKILILLVFLIAGNGVKAQNDCSTANEIYAAFECNPTSFNTSSSFWFHISPTTDTNFINIVRDTGNNNPYSFIIYRGNCGNLQKIDSVANIQSDTFNVMQVLLKNNDYYIKITGNGGFAICVLEPVYPHVLLAYDADGNQIGNCVNYLNYPYIKTCTLDERLCTGDSIAIQFQFHFLDVYRSDSVVFDMPGNIYGQHYVYIPPLAGVSTPYVPVGYNYPTTAGNPYHVCATAYYSVGITPPGTSVNYTTCFTINVDSIPRFELTMNPDTVCPECDGEFDNMACAHIYGLNWSDPSLNIEINWGDDPNSYEGGDTCVVYFYTGTYPVIATVTNHCGSYKDTAWLEVSLRPIIYAADTVCLLSTLHFEGASLCNDANIVNYAWNFSDGQSVSGANYESVNHTFSQIGSYIVQLIITDYCGNKDTTTKVITVIPPPLAPQIAGNHNNCTLSTNYSIANPIQGATYVWTISNSNPSYSNSFPATGTSISVTWVNLDTYVGQNAEYTWLFVEVTDNNGCTIKDSIKIWKCCTPYNLPGSVVNDMIITSPSQLTNGDVVNGTIIIAATMPLNATPLYMGPEAKIIINPPNIFTITTKTISAGCQYMWDGIYVSDSNAKIKIDNSSIIQDALNAVVSENGGKFELLNSKFYKNFTSVLVKNNWWGPYQYPFKGYPHKGFIKGCLFANYGTGMIAPYAGQKTRYGIYADNVDRLTIGDSTVAGNTNTFRSLFCGVYSKNSEIKLVNNNFRRIKSSSNCYPQYPEVFTTMYCETAIFSIYYNPDGIQLNNSQLTCGGNSTITRNTFDTCNMGVYTYMTTTKLTKNMIYNTTTGIKCRDIRFGSYISHSSMQTNITTGIQVINTIAVLTKVTVMYDTILDPTSGIYLLNIASNTTYAKSVVNNNYITNAKNTSVYGINLEKCDRIEAYCNKVTRIAIPTTAYRLYIKGIQISQCEYALIHDNISERIGLSIKGAGSLLGTQFKCNTSDGSYNGFYFDAAYGTVQTALSSQGIATLPNDNKWLNVPANFFGIDAGATFLLPTPISWYYRNVGAQYNPTLSATAAGSIIKFSAGNPLQSSCTSCGGMFMSGLNSTASNFFNTSEIESIIDESSNYGELDASFKYFEKQYAYNTLSNTETLNDQTASEFLLELANGNIGKFDRIYRMIQYDQYDSAVILNNLISPINQIEINRQWVNKVYLDYVVPQITIPQNLINELEILASSSPFVNGDAVYTARAIVGYTENETGVNNKSREVIQNDTILQILKVEIKVYPNPANDYVTVEIIGNTDKSIKFLIMNTLGIRLLEKTLYSNLNRIEVHQIKRGIYIYEASFVGTNEPIIKGRLIINN